MLTQPVGSALGLSSQLAQNLGTLYQPDREVPYYTRWEIGVQHELPHGWVVGVHVSRLARPQPAGRAADQQHPDRVPVHVAHARHAALETLLFAERAESVRGPDAGRRVQRRYRRAQPAACGRIPQFGTISVEQYDGSDRYEARHRCSSTSASGAATR